MAERLRFPSVTLILENRSHSEDQDVSVQLLEDDHHCLVDRPTDEPRNPCAVRPNDHGSLHLVCFLIDVIRLLIAVRR